jgi:hypothetical protein
LSSIGGPGKNQPDQALPTLKFHSLGDLLHGDPRERPVSAIFEVGGDSSVLEAHCHASPSFGHVRSPIDIPEQNESISFKHGIAGSGRSGRSNFSIQSIF